MGPLPQGEGSQQLTSLY